MPPKKQTMMLHGPDHNLFLKVLANPPAPNARLVASFKTYARLTAKNRPPPHPGEVLPEECIKPLGLTQAAAARHLDVPIQRLRNLLRGRSAMTAETALRISSVFGSSPEFWMNLQIGYDLRRARDRAAKALKRLHPINR
jgi:addiction module HigA family antidote